MNIIIYILSFFLCTFFLFLFHRMQMNQFKTISQNRLLKLKNEIKKENEISQNFQESSLSLTNLKKNSQKKLLKIKLEIQDIDFTLKEICKFI